MTSVRKVIVLVATTMTMILPRSAAAQTPDPTGFGPFGVASAEYKSDAVLDPDVLNLRPTELWAVLFHPDPLDQRPHPLLIFLHGNHPTCGHGANPRFDDNVEYTFDGTCPADYVVTPNHRGYDYLAERLASWGYIVVSINANRGINGAEGSEEDLGLNLARGKLLLKHMQALSEWNRNGGTPESLQVDLQGRLDFAQVGLFGHSRGGEGVRAAYNLYRDADSIWPSRIGPVGFAGVFEVAPVDGQTSRILNADGTAWNLLLGMCDEDVSDLQGIRVFDRMMLLGAETPARQKSTFNVWGANHNYFNSEWQVSDSRGCVGHEAIFTPSDYGSENQRLTSLAGAMAFFRGNVGVDANPSFTRMFNPLIELPDVVRTVTRVDRGYADSPDSSITSIFEDFDKPTGTNTFGFPNDASHISIQHSECTGDLTTECPNSITDHDTEDSYFRFGQQQTAAISWTNSGADVFFQSNWAATEDGKDIRGFQTLEMRASRQCATPACDAQNSLNPGPSTDFSVRLVIADGTLSQPVQISAYANLTGPVGGTPCCGFVELHPLLQTARIPLRDFADVDLQSVRGVRLTFDVTATGAIFVSNIRLSQVGSASAFRASDLITRTGQSTASAQAGGREITDGNSLTIRMVDAAAALVGQPGVEIEVTSTTAFPVLNELAVLRIGSLAVKLSRYRDNGDTHTLIFTLTPAQFAVVNTGDLAWVQYGAAKTAERWIFGPLTK